MMHPDTAIHAGENLSSIEEVLEDVRKGRMIVLVDAKARENEGDLVIPAETTTPDVINFMAMYGRGLICLALGAERVAELGLSLMPRDNLSRHQTAFTVSIEAREGVTTGISAADRAHTIAVAIDPSKGKQDISTPGHVFPLVARDSGVLVRAGHTEAAVDIARLAGFNPSGVICEIMNDDGTMARMPDLVPFAQRHGIKIATISDLISYRLRHDTLIERALESEFDSAYGGVFRTIIYVNRAQYAEHIALVKGDISGPEPVLVRVHAFDILGDLLGERPDRGDLLHRAMRMIGDEGRGVVVLIRESGQTSLSDRTRAKLREPQPEIDKLREIGIGSQILRDLGVSDMVLLSNAQRTMVGLEGYGLRVVDQRNIPVD